MARRVTPKDELTTLALLWVALVIGGGFALWYWAPNPYEYQGGDVTG